MTPNPDLFPSIAAYFRDIANVERYCEEKYAHAKSYARLPTTAPTPCCPAYTRTIPQLLYHLDKCWDFLKIILPPETICPIISCHVAIYGPPAASSAASSSVMIPEILVEWIPPPLSPVARLFLTFPYSYLLDSPVEDLAEFACRDLRSVTRLLELEEFQQLLREVSK